MSHPRIHARTIPDKPAAIFACGSTLTYAELDSRANQVAHLLRSAGIARGGSVALFLDNEPAFFEIAWACQRAGVYCVPTSNKLLPDELAYILLDSGAKLLFTSRSLSETARAACERANLPIPVVTGVGESFEANRNIQPTTPITDEAAGVDMVYSSGTTGRPKGVMPELPEGPVEAETRMMVTARLKYGVTSNAVYLSPAPLYHAAPLRWCMTVHRIGGTVVVLEKFDPERVLQLIDAFGVTHAQFVPTHFARLLSLPEDVRSRYSHRSLEAVLHAAAPCPRTVKQAMFDWWGPILYEYYGGSEGNGVTIVTPEEWQVRPGTVGKAVGCEVRICDEDGEPLPQGETGLVYFAGGPKFEYHNDPEKTAQSRNRYGWSTLGDIGYLDAEGYLFLTDRKSFMIISGGVNVYPQEIEDALLSHPEVTDAAVVAAPHPDLGEQVAAVVQPRDWQHAGAELAEELRAFLQARLSPLKVPRRIDFVAEMPRLPTGKLMKRLIRDAYFGQNDEIAGQLKKGVHR